MMTYLEPDAPAAHVDYPPLVTNERGAAKHAIPPGSVACPKCNGWGGHNLRLDAYPLRNMDNTAENRHMYSHFKASCDQCAGWGHVPAEDAACVHDFKHHRNVGNCLNEYRCSKCGKTWTVDSSD